jgi:hypothetical protein
LETVAWEPIAAVLVAVVGWHVTHRSQLKAQKEQLRHQVLNEARVQITDSLRSYQTWLSKLSSDLLATSALFDAEQFGDIDWSERYRRWTDHLNQRPTGKYWLAALEEYDILFPELRVARAELANRHKELDGRVRSIIDDVRRFLSPGDIRSLAAAGAKLQPTAEFVLDQAALMEDLRIHLQNRALGEISGKVVPLRVPRDPDLPCMISDDKGLLRVREGGRLKPGGPNAV